MGLVDGGCFGLLKRVGWEVGMWTAQKPSFYLSAASHCSRPAGPKTRPLTTRILFRPQIEPYPPRLEWTLYQCPIRRMGRITCGVEIPPIWETPGKEADVDDSAAGSYF